MNLPTTWGMLAVAVLLIGCSESADTVNTSAAPASPIAAPAPPPPAPPAPPPPPAPAAAASATPVTAPDAPPAAPTGDVVKAEAGVGKKGRGYGGGVVTEIIRAKFASEQRIVFDIQIPKAMQLFKATNDRAPKTHEEFMTAIIQENGIVLPELPAGDRYFYDPKLEELMVEQQRPTPGSQ